MKGRIANDNIQTLNEGEVFVFGSNLAGYHGAGAAAKAHRDFGALMGQGIGVQGDCYAIPTKGFKLSIILTLEEIQEHVNVFIEHAKQNPDKTFLVTQIGCGYAGYSPAQIAPLFKEAEEIQNIHLPESFWQILNNI